MSKKQMGFTLIEIVMVLVLLGILSAVAVPKYFDLRAQAELKAAQAIVAEGQARINATFADQLLSGKTCKQALEEVTKSGSTVLNNIAENWTLSYTAAVVDTQGKVTAEAETKLVKKVGDEKTTFTSSSKEQNTLLQIQNLVFPECAVTTSKPKTGE